MKVALLSFAVAALAAASSVGAVNSPKYKRAPRNFLDTKTSVAPGRFMVTFDAEPGTQQVHDAISTLKNDLAKLGVDATVAKTFPDVFSGAAINVKDEDAHKVADLNIVKEIFNVHQFSIPAIEKPLYPDEVLGASSSPNLVFAHNLTGSIFATETLGFTGKGVKVGVIDTGIDYKHPALGGCFKGPGCRVQYGYDIVGNAYDSSTNPVATPDPDPMDECNGHGTHVAGIIGALDKKVGFRGVAPEVTYGAYRVFGCAGKGTTDTVVMVEAMNAAYKDGMDIINMSIGGGSSWSSYPTAAVGSFLASKGMLVVASAGNDGAYGLFDTGAPAHGDRVLSVASFDNIKTVLPQSFALSTDANRLVGHSFPADQRRAFNFTGASAAIVADSTGSPRACAPITQDLKGKIAFLQRGDCNHVVKAKNAQDAGAIGVIAYNQLPGAFSPGFTDDTVTIPYIGITDTDGAWVLSQLTANAATTVTEKNIPVGMDVPTGGTVSDFSSFGPGSRLEIKPDIGAPGGLIYSTYLTGSGGYATLSGTSMASPYAAGSAAILQQAFGKQNTEVVRARLRSTASPRNRYKSTGIETVAHQGSGLVDLTNALGTKTIVSPSKIALNDTDSTFFGLGYKVMVVQVTNSDSKSTTYSLSHTAAESATSYAADGVSFLNKPDVSTISAGVTFFGNQFTLSAGETRLVPVVFSPPSGLDKKRWWIFSGHVNITPQNSFVTVKAANGTTVSVPQKPVHVPYLGMHGYHGDIKILDYSTGLPKLINYGSSANITDTANPVTFSLNGTDVPAVRTRSMHPTAVFAVRVLDGNNDKPLGYIDNDGYQTYFGRNMDKDGARYYTWPWSGGVFQLKNLTDIRPLPDGKYKLRVEALRPEGNFNNIRDYETWTTPAFLVKRK
ncbi:subtilisin-like protein [Ramicandelaber brevisporus]|nr:subtilisin-like protein [Ramicandelaber brevisporus]